MKGNIHKQNGNIPVWLAIIIILVVAFLALLVWQAVKEGPASPKKEITFKKPVPDYVSTYVGDVASVGAQRFTMRAKAARNYFTEDRNLTIAVDSHTLFFILIPANPSTGMLTDRNPGTFRDIKVGDQVSVSASGDVKDLPEFLADEVEIAR